MTAGKVFSLCFFCLFISLSSLPAADSNTTLLMYFFVFASLSTSLDSELFFFCIQRAFNSDMPTLLDTTITEQHDYCSSEEALLLVIQAHPKPDIASRLREGLLLIRKDTDACDVPLRIDTSAIYCWLALKKFSICFADVASVSLPSVRH